MSVGRRSSQDKTGSQIGGGKTRNGSQKWIFNLMRELKQQDVCDMEVDLAEVMWQESDDAV